MHPAGTFIGRSGFLPPRSTTLYLSEDHFTGLLRLFGLCYAAPRLRDLGWAPLLVQMLED
jgi:hypothetical protein